SHIHLGDFGTLFAPADPIELINTISVSSRIGCAQTCNLNSLCRTLDYDTLSKRCRLFEGEITTGQVNRSAAVPSTSRVGSIAYTQQLYLVYNQTCNQCQINRYLLCINNTCQCPPHTYWNGSMCLNQGYNGSSCQNGEWCRNDKNITCSSSHLCDQWNFTTSMTIAREYHTATLLNSGKLLVTGGMNTSGSALPSCEIYDPSSGQWNTTASMATAREQHTATLLNSGKVLVTGGYTTSGILAGCEIYDPSSGQWNTTASMATARQVHTATLLNSGKVLVTGGEESSGQLASCEIYYP
ncbi:unnamed protein product, partial [Didymodactylos carnosus]